MQKPCEKKTSLQIRGRKYRWQIHKNITTPFSGNSIHVKQTYLEYATYIDDEKIYFQALITIQILNYLAVSLSLAIFPHRQICKTVDRFGESLPAN